MRKYSLYKIITSKSYLSYRGAIKGKQEYDKRPDRTARDNGYRLYLL